ncbi:MAG TPA: hypothetical protein DD477_06755 [Spirochaetaceae bacterium]|nr:hypothetical protein [Spirochaetaceae bacterium]
MRRRFRLSLILAVIGLPVSGFFIAGSVWPTELAARASVPQSSHNGDPLSADELARLAPGDFILRRGNSLVSRLIVYSLGEPTGYSHCGILWPDPASGTWQVIHSVSEALSGTDGLRREPLADFWRKSLPDSTTVVRYRADQATVAAMLETANRLLAAPPAFDNGFQLGGDSLYCSELLWLVLPATERGSFIRLQAPIGVIRFESFLDPAWFETILDHRMAAARPDEP